jgi:hypothetical protein
MWHLFIIQRHPLMPACIWVAFYGRGDLLDAASPGFVPRSLELCALYPNLDNGRPRFVLLIAVTGPRDSRMYSSRVYDHFGCYLQARLHGDHTWHWTAWDGQIAERQQHRAVHLARDFRLLLGVKSVSANKIIWHGEGKQKELSRYWLNADIIELRMYLRTRSYGMGKESRNNSLDTG